VPHPDRSTKSSGPEGRGVLLAQVPSPEAPGTATLTIDGTPFLGRTRELAVLDSAFERAAAGHGTLVLLGGEGGIGKTRLVSEAISRWRAGDPAAESPRVAWGRCWDSGGAPSLWPWTCVLRELFSSSDDDQALRDQLGPAAPVLAAIVPELHESLPELEDEPALDSEQSRFVLFDGLAEFLRRTSARRPLVIVLDDLHAADQLSLLALLFVARQLAEMRVLVIGTHREVEMQTSPLAGLFAKLLRASERIPLTGLDPDHIGRLIEHRGGSGTRPEVAQHLHRATGGNPFFADEVVRMLVSEGGLEILTDDPALPLRVPIGVQALIEQRLADLPEATLQALQSGAVIGDRFSLATVAEATGRSRPELLQALEPAIEARLIDVAPGEVAKFSFVHDLIRETVYAELGSLERARTHAAVGEALARRYAGTADRHVEELAHHFLEALPAGDPAIAVEYAERAGDHAMERFAHERAARLYNAGCEALELVDGLSEAERSLRRSALMLGQGQAQLRIGDGQARETLLEAAAAARAAGSADALAHVALAFGAFALSPRRVDEELTDLLVEALAGIGTADCVLRVHLLGRLARALYWSEENDRRRRLIDEAIAMARRLDDEEALGIALGNCIPASRGPDTAELELSWIDELLSLPKTPGELVVLARSIEIDLLLERGAIAAADAAIDSLEHHADRLRDLRARAYVPVHRARRAIMEGRYEDAQRLIKDAFAISQDVEESTIPLIATGLLFTLSWAKGRPGGVEQELRRVAEALPYMQVWRLGLALIRAADGDRAEAERMWAGLAAAEFADIQRNNQWLITVTLAAELCAQLGDAARAAALYELLAPFAELSSVAPAGAYAGPVDRYLGLLAQTTGDAASAERHLRAGLELARRHRSRPLIALIAVDLARTLGPSTPAEAGDLLDEAERLAEELDSPGIVERAVSVRGVLDGAGPAEAKSPPSKKPISALVSREGEVWAFELSGRTVRVRDSKGIRHLAELLAQPGVEVHALDLVRAGGDGESAAAAADAGLSLDSGAGAGSALDPAAKAAYRRRLEDLREEVDEAVRWGDPERGARAREEIDFIAAELAAAVGLGGRDRPQASDAERARVNVTRAIKTAIRRLGAQDAELGAELEATVHTGLFCRHEPDPRRPVHWEVHAG